MGPAVRVRGIYGTALMKFFKERGVTHRLSFGTPLREVQGRQGDGLHRDRARLSHEV